ncbi:MAG: ABC transporter ATP-binding protein [Aquincola sp.]|nr:ABC transporter ATP-binding protein [Aquincola sp.]
MTALLEVRNLRVDFGDFTAVDGLDLVVDAGEVLGIVGESGSGKSVAMLALLGLVDAPGHTRADTIAFDGRGLQHMSAAERRKVVGKDITIVFQDAQASLDPAYSVGFQIGEVLTTHQGLHGDARRRRVIELLEQVEMPDPRRRIDAYPHQLSGGMNQRVTIAMALAADPRLLIADEPTTALDVTVQAQIMALLARLQAERRMALVLITHDLALVAQQAQAVAVMYAGQIVETAPATSLFDVPRHPYTAALLASLPEHHKGARRLEALGGAVPGRLDRPHGCLFAPRCGAAQTRCHAERPALRDGVRCFFPLGMA